MKITAIEINKESAEMVIGGRKLIGVILTTKNWIGNVRLIKAYPTNYGKVGASNCILYYHFSDELGKELGGEISKQINNFLLNQELI